MSRGATEYTSPSGFAIAVSIRGAAEHTSIQLQFVALPQDEFDALPEEEWTL